MPDNKNEIDPKIIKLLKYRMTINLCSCIILYPTSIGMLGLTAYNMDSQKWGWATICAFVGFWDWCSANNNLKQYMKIRNALNEYNRKIQKK